MEQIKYIIIYNVDWNVRFTFIWNFFKALFEHLQEIFEHAIKRFSVKLSCYCNVIVLVIMQTKSF